MRQTTELGQLRASTISSRQLILSLQKKIHLWGEEVEDERWEKSFLVQWTLLIFLKTIAKGTTDQPAVASFDSCYRLLTALTAVTSCRQFWHLLQTVASFDIFYKLSPALTADTSCRQLWHLLQAVVSFDSCYKLKFLSFGTKRWSVLTSLTRVGIRDTSTCVSKTRVW